MINTDSKKLGVLLGILGPFIGMITFYWWKFKSVSVLLFLQTLGVERRLLTSMVTFSLFANAVLFTIFINKHKDKTAIGIFAVTLVWALAAMILKWAY
jgi:tryptophan-rich sensory protein